MMSCTMPRVPLTKPCATQRLCVTMTRAPRLKCSVRLKVSNISGLAPDESLALMRIASAFFCSI